MLLNEIFNNETIIRIEANTSDIMKMSFSVEDIRYQFIAQSLDEEPSTWYTEYYKASSDSQRTPPSNKQTQFSVLSGILNCLKTLMKNHSEIESLVFSVKKDSAQINLFDNIVKRKMFPGWSLVDQKDGWFKISKTNQ